MAAKAKEIEDAVYDLKAVNPNKRPVVDTRTPEELLDIILEKGQEIAQALAMLRDMKINLVHQKTCDDRRNLLP